MSLETMADRRPRRRAEGCGCLVARVFELIFVRVASSVVDSLLGHSSRIGSGNLGRGNSVATMPTLAGENDWLV